MYGARAYWGPRSLLIPAAGARLRRRLRKRDRAIVTVPDPDMRNSSLEPAVDCTWRSRPLARLCYSSEMKYVEGLSCKECHLSLIHISEPTRRTPISYAVFCLKKKKKNKTQ